MYAYSYVMVENTWEAFTYNACEGMYEWKKKMNIYAYMNSIIVPKCSQT